MAKIYLDANIFIDIVEERSSLDIKQFADHTLFISPLSVHILTYLYKYKMPNEALLRSIQKIKLISCNDVVTYNALLGPTSDFEDNVQLRSAATAECDFFLTSDKKLLDLTFFGKTQILPGLSG